MTPYCTRFISEDDLALFEKIKNAIVHLSDPDLGLDEAGHPVVLSCHILARAVARVFPVHVRDGYFAKIYEHSWVVTQHGHLIDIYPVAVVGGPIMFDGSPASPQKFIYKATSASCFSRGRFSRSSFRRSVRRVAKSILAATDNDKSVRGMSALDRTGGLYGTM